MSRAAKITVEIASLGANGDGIAETPSGRVYVPYAVPGDRLLVRMRRVKGVQRGQIAERLADGADRCEPICRHFTDCGGCAVQQIAGDSYRSWKREFVGAALQRRGFDPAIVGDLVPGEVGRRRRARFFARRTAAGAVLGFHSQASHMIVQLAECPIMSPEIVALLPPLRRLVERLFAVGVQVEIAVTACHNGLDVTFYAPDEPEMSARVALAEFAEIHDLARLSWSLTGDGATAEPVVRRRAASIRFGDVVVEPPPDAFLQPTEAGEAALRVRIEDALGGTQRIADLYAGCGAFALPLASAGRHVFAIDNAADHIAALENSARSSGFGPFVRTEIRDLHHRPLAGRELADLDAVILDPPRAGAATQAMALVESQVPVIAYASCDPRSFGRDARILCDGGYRLEAVTPVDQFLFTPHVELVGVFRR
jgi:23S rRNA (uracil1939-C5)-methyltransferase